MLVSVIVNSHNYGAYLDDCIQSVLAQTYPNVEIIVYDDGSSDDSLEVLGRYGSKIRVIAESNHGDYPSFNQANAISKAFTASVGEIVCLLDADDMFKPHKVERVVEAFGERIDVVLVQHVFEEVDADGERTGYIRPEIVHRNIKKNIFEHHNLIGMFAQTSALSFRRDYLKQVLPIEKDDYETIWSDVRLTRQTVFFGNVVTIDEPLGMYRVHDKNDSRKLKDSSYFKRVLNQMYGYFNERSRIYGFPEIDYKFRRD